MGKFEKNFSLKMLTVPYFQKEIFGKKKHFFMKKIFVNLKEKVLFSEGFIVRERVFFFFFFFFLTKCHF